MKKLISKRAPSEDGGETAEAEDGRGLVYSEARKRLIRRLENARQATALVYIDQTGGGRPDNLLRYLFEHLRSIRGRTHDKIAVVVYTRPSVSGPEGTHRELDHALRMMALLREHTREVEVLIPSVAYGVGTYMAIGADRLFIHPLGTLGRLSAADHLAPARHFLRLLADAGVSSGPEQAAVLGRLVDDCGARTLGEARYAISRLNAGIRDLVAGRVHRRQEAQNQALFEALVDSACPLAHPVDRRRAKELLALPIESLDPELEAILWELFSSYEHPLRLSTRDPGANPPQIVLESEHLCHGYQPAGAGKGKMVAGRSGEWVRVVGTAVQ